MSERNRDPQQKYLVIDGPMKGREVDHSDDHFYMAQINAPASGGDGVIRPLERVRYQLCERDGQLVWSCEAPL